MIESDVQGYPRIPNRADEKVIESGDVVAIASLLTFLDEDEKLEAAIVLKERYGGTIVG